VSEGQSHELRAEFALAASELLTLASASQSRALYQLVELAARHVPRCSGAIAMLWQDGEVALTAASHPDLSELADVQQASGGGPAVEAAADGRQVTCADLLGETRWPEYASRALSVGVRSSVTLVHSSGPAALTLTMYATRQGTLDPERVPIGELLITLAGAVMRNTSAYDAAKRTVRHLSEGADARSVVDKAKGILMVSFGCTADEALQRMRTLSQSRHIKVTEVARRIVDSHELESGQGRAFGELP
jgi:hypothetical protein